MKDSYDVAIIGAGVSGLTAGYFLKDKGYDVAVIEKDYSTGGSIKSLYEMGYTVDMGPNTVLETTPLFREIAGGLGILDMMIHASPEAKKRYILKDGKLNALPGDPISLIKTKLLSGKAKMGVFKEPFVPPLEKGKDETVADFVNRRLGDEFRKYVIDPFIAGVYAGVPEQLSVNSAFPKLREIEQKYGSLIKGMIKGKREKRQSGEVSKQSAGMFTFQGGLQTFTNALTAYFQDNLVLGAELQEMNQENGQHNLKIKRMDEHFNLSAKVVLFAIPAHAYENIPVDRAVKNSMAKIYYPPVTMAYYGYRGDPARVELDGFGFLVPSSEKRNILGNLWTSVIFPDRAPTTSIALTTFIGGSRQPENALLPSDQVHKLVRKDLLDIMGIDVKPEYDLIATWEKSIPQYGLDHKDIISEVEKYEEKNKGIYFTGNFRGGISVADCVKNSKLFSDKIDSYLKNGKE